MNKTFIIFRILIYILVFLLFLQPAKKVYRKHTTPVIAVLLDESESMKLDSPARIGNAKKNIFSEFYGNSSFKTLFYAFSKDRRLLSEDEIKRIKPTGKDTDIAGALEYVKMEFSGRELDAVFLYSDGNQTVDKSIEETLAELKEMKIPVYTIVPSKYEKTENISIKKIDVPEIAFRNTEIKVTAVLSAIGVSRRKSIIYLKSEDRLLQTKEITLPENGDVECMFNFIPEKAGINYYTVETPYYKNEKTGADNRMDFSLKVQAEKIRVLLLSGMPSFDYSFLRAALKSDPVIDLVSFVILRNPENVIPVPDSELSLIPFPVDELFSKNIFDFDLLIFDDFNHAKFSVITAYLNNIRKFVYEQGKSFIMIHGEVSPSVYLNTPIADIMPIVPTNQYREGRFRIEVKNAEHGITRLVENDYENKAIWENMPELDGINVCSPKKGAVSPIVDENTKSPIITAAQAGKGRVVDVATSSLWRIALGGENPYNYARLVRQIVQWVTDAPSMKQVAIYTQRNYNMNDTARIKILVKNENSKPVSDAAVNVEINIPSGGKIVLPAPPAANEGEYHMELELLNPGRYGIIAKAYAGNRYMGSDSSEISVSGVSKELKTLFCDAAYMKNIADKTGGQFYYIDDFNAGELKIKPRIVKSDVLYEINIFNKPLFYVFLVVFLTIEWFLRRRNGLF